MNCISQSSAHLWDEAVLEMMCRAVFNHPLYIHARRWRLLSGHQDVWSLTSDLYSESCHLKATQGLDRCDAGDVLRKGSLDLYLWR